MGDLLLDHGGTRDAGIAHQKSHSRRRNFIVATFSPARDEFQSRVAGATNVVVGNTDLTTPTPIGGSRVSGTSRSYDKIFLSDP
jgi:hypothetical protein